MYCLECYTENPEGVLLCQKCGCLLDPPDMEEKNLIQGRYEIISSLSEGGMGGISVAYDLNLNKSCALKEISVDYIKKLSPGEKDRVIKLFKKEAELLARLRHPNLPYVSNYFVDNNRCYIVMDYIEGKDFEVILEENENEGLDEKQVIEWAIQICRILEYLHGQKPPVVHGDIKSANIIVRNSDGWLMLVDFGSAVSKNIKEKGETSGTPGYAAPELYDGILDEKSDMYSLGATLYELLTGGLPEEEFDFIPLCEVNPEITPELEKTIMKCLNYERSERYGSILELKQDLLSLYKKFFSPPVNKYRTSTLIESNGSISDMEDEIKTAPIKVFIINNDIQFYEAFQNIAKLLKGIVLTGNALNGKEAIDILKKVKEKPDVILIDVNMPVINGIVTARLSKEILPQVKIVMLTAEVNEKEFLDSLNAGASGYILKTESSWEDLEKSIKKAYNGGMPICPEASSLLVKAFSGTKGLSLRAGTEKEKICIFCNTNNDFEAEYCKKCGSYLNESDNPDENDEVIEEIVIIEDGEDGEEFIEEIIILEDDENQEKSPEKSCETTKIDNIHKSWAYNAMGSKYYIENKKELALEHYKKAIEIYAENADAHINIGNFILKDLQENGKKVDEKKINKALYHFSRVIDLKPEGPIFCEAEKGIKELEGFLVKEKNEEIYINDKTSDSSIIKVEFSDRIISSESSSSSIFDISSQAVSSKNIDNKTSVTLLERDEIPEEEETWEEMEPKSIYQQMLKITPLDPVIYNKIGFTYFQCKEPNQSLYHFKKALEIDPEFPEALLNLGLVYKENKKILKALHSLRLCIKVSKDNNIKNIAQNYIKEIENMDFLKSQDDSSIKAESVMEVKEEKFEDRDKKYTASKNEVERNEKIEKLTEKPEKTPVEQIRPEERINSFKEELKNSPGDPVIYNKLGRVYYDYGNYDEAFTNYEKAIILDPDCAEAHLNLALFYRDRNNILKSMRHLRLCAKTAQDKSLKIMAEKYLAEIEEKGSDVKSNDKSPAYETREVIIKKKRIESENEEIVKFKEDLEKNPEDLETITSLANKYKEKGELEKALEYYNKALDVKKDPRIYLDTALIYKELGNFSKALEYFKNSARKSTSSELLSEAKNNITQIEENLKEDKESPPDKEIKEKSHIEKEIKILKESLKSSGDEVSIHLKLGKLYSEAGHMDNGIEHYNKYLKLNKNDAIAYSELALLYKSKGNIFNSLRYLRVAISKTEDRELKEIFEKYIKDIEEGKD